ncbi:hypothetical protein L484_022226 [Morus notabilis]|uniref:Uncharacterized protein n=1 Tax=Morus notabilis TaxID=981085 RepID=W9RNJ0_9ROSA|nr:hypothetical protein L484_022226 [Morus notabilis]
MVAGSARWLLGREQKLLWSIHQSLWRAQGPRSPKPISPRQFLRRFRIAYVASFHSGIPNFAHVVSHPVLYW